MCTSCMDLMADFKKAAKHLAGIKFGIIDTTGYSEWTLNRGITTVPTLQLFQNFEKRKPQTMGIRYILVQ